MLFDEATLWRDLSGLSTALFWGFVSKRVSEGSISSFVFRRDKGALFRSPFMLSSLLFNLGSILGSSSSATLVHERLQPIGHGTTSTLNLP